MNRLEQCKAEYRHWCQKRNIQTISDINNIINSGYANNLINLSETWHEQKLSEIALHIKNEINNIRIIMISGPSSSGKTSFAHRMQLHLNVMGIRAFSISLDNYYFPRDKVPKTPEGKPDFECLESIDYKLFNRHVLDLMSGKKVSIPHFDFENATINYNQKGIELMPDEVIIVEGIHGLNPAITCNIPDENIFRIYCSPLSVLLTDEGERIKSSTTRLIRRTIRDYYFRNTECAKTFEMWNDVELSAEKNIYPYTDSADFIFNSSILYEMCVYRNHLNRIFKNTNPGSEGYETAKALFNLVNKFDRIEKDSTPRISIIREFVGSSSLEI